MSKPVPKIPISFLNENLFPQHKLILSCALMRHNTSPCFNILLGLLEYHQLIKQVP